MMRPMKALTLAGPLLVVSLLGAACSSSSKSSSSSASSSSSSSSSAATGGSSSSGAPATTAAGAKVSGTLNGSGSTFQQAYDEAVIQSFTQANSGTTINYQGKGSGGGQTDLANQVVDF